MVRLDGFFLRTVAGDVYDGNYVANKKHGKGVFLQADGTRYEGHGYCTMSDLLTSLRRIQGRHG